MTKTAIINARVFDGREMLESTTVVIDGDHLGTDPTGAVVVDGSGATLMPGLIDAHVHLHGPDTLEQLAGYGVTTALDMATWPPALVDSLRGRPGVTDIRSAGIPASATGSAHSRIPGFPAAGLVDNPAAAPQFVADRVAEGSDYIKIIADIPGPDQATINALVTAAHEHGKLTVAHAVSSAAFAMALGSRADIITHAPLDNAAVATMDTDDRVFIPTLSMMEGVVQQGQKPGADYGAARACVTALYRAGAPILAGTDANAAPGVPAAIKHGESLHHELELLVDAGLSNLDALRAATSLPANHFGLLDRGVIEPGRRADLLLIGGDPTENVRATRDIRRIWCNGVEHTVTTPEVETGAR
jgi:imidazolonepropionase-like amidohydrolase